MTHTSFVVRGTPTPKGSTTRMPNGATLPAGTPDSRKRMAQWREDIRRAATDAMGDTPTFTGPIRLFVEFSLAPPMSTIRKYQWGWLPHTKKPDVDKLFRMIGDCCTGIVWNDDAQICVSAVNKRYAWDGITGAVVEVSEIGDEEAKRWAEANTSIRKFLEVLS